MVQKWPHIPKCISQYANFTNLEINCWTNCFFVLCSAPAERSTPWRLNILNGWAMEFGTSKQGLAQNSWNPATPLSLEHQQGISCGFRIRPITWFTKLVLDLLQLHNERFRIEPYKVLPLRSLSNPTFSF